MRAADFGTDIVTELSLPEEVRTTIRSDAMQSYPDECCGFLLGTWQSGEARINSALPVLNIRQENRRRRFEISPEDFARAEAHAEHLQTGLIGIYHSHPDHPAEPSAYDLDHAFPGLLNLIVSIRQGEVSDERCWELRPDRSGFVELRLRRQGASGKEQV